MKKLFRNYDTWKLATPPQFEEEDECKYCGEPTNGNGSMCEHCQEEQEADANED